MKPLTLVIALAAIAAVVTIIAVLRLAASKRVMNPDQFAEAVLARIRTRHADIGIKRADGFELILVIRDKERTIYLDNCYATYRNYPDHFEEIVDEFIGALAEPHDTDLTWAEARRKLFPALRAQLYLEQAREMGGGAEIVDRLIVLDYRDDLKILLAIDFESSMTFATKQQLREWDVSEDEALKCAIDNLSKLTAPHWAEATELARQAALFAFNTRDGYDASRILLPDFYERASRALGCERIAVGIPNRDFLVAIPADNPRQLTRQKAQIEKDYQTQDHPISPDLIFLPR